MTAAQVPGVRFPLTGFERPPEAAGYPRYQPQAAPINTSAILIKAVLATLFCCMICGIPSIIYAAQAQSHAARGDFMSAKTAADKANKWANVSIIGGLIFTTIYVVCVIAFGMN